MGKVIAGGEQCGRKASVHECVLLVGAANALLDSSGGGDRCEAQEEVDVCNVWMGEGEEEEEG